MIKVLKALLYAYEQLCDQFCKDPMRNEAYRNAKEALK